MSKEKSKWNMLPKRNRVSKLERNRIRKEQESREFSVQHGITLVELRDWLNLQIEKGLVEGDMNWDVGYYDSIDNMKIVASNRKRGG